MNRFNVRPIAVIPALPEVIPYDKKPSAYNAMKHGSGPIVAPVISHVEEPKKGRPTKEDVRRRKLEMASASICVLVESKPTRAKIRDYIQQRIEQLDDDKR